MFDGPPSAPPNTLTLTFFFFFFVAARSIPISPHRSYLPLTQVSTAGVNHVVFRHDAFLFPVSKLQQVGLANLHRIMVFWPMVTAHLIEVRTCVRIRGRVRVSGPVRVNNGQRARGGGLCAIACCHLLPDPETALGLIPWVRDHTRWWT